MRVVRIDQLAPGGAALEVHPRLTLLRGASPELRRRLRATIRSLAGDGELGEAGVIEVSGVQLAMDAPTLAQLRLDGGIDPVMDFVVVDDGVAAPVASQAGAQLPPPVVVVSQGEAELRTHLRTVTTARTELGARMEAARAGLDSYSTAALEVCLGQIEALEARRATLRVDWERDRGERDGRLGAASAQLAAVRALVDRIAGLDAARRRTRTCRDDVVSVGERAGVPDPAATQLAAQLDAAAARVRDLEDRRHHLQAQLTSATEALAGARAAADDAERAVRTPQVDRSVVQRLESVRDEIFAVDDRQSVLGAARNKRRLAELRSEEAILLDRLGFDTYSSYVMGIPSVRAELERTAQVSDAREAADQLEGEVAMLRSRAGDRSEQDDAAVQLQRLLGESLRMLGAPADLRTEGDLAHEVATGGPAAELVRRTASSLRARTLVDARAAEDAATSLRDALRDAAAAAGSIRFALPPGPVALPGLPEPPAEVDTGLSEDLVAAADRWLVWHDEVQSWMRATEGSVVELERTVAELGAGPDAERIGRWAEVEAELDEALDRLAEAQERVRAHDAATAELAALRTEELELRDRERELLARIAAADAAIVPPPPPPPPAVPEPPVVGGRVDDGSLAHSDPEVVEWAVVARLARQRAVSFIGSVPLLVEGLPIDAPARDLVLRRLDRMSDLVQVIVLAEDDSAAAWAGGLGERGRRVDL